MVIKQGNDFDIRYLATIPSSVGSGVEQSLISLALKYCLAKGGSVSMSLSEELIREHQEQVFVQLMLNQYAFEL